MKKTFYIVIALFFTCTYLNAQTVKSIYIDNIPDSKIGKKMGYYTSIVFDKINKSFTQNIKPNFPPECISQYALNNILRLWDNTQFTIDTNKLQYAGIITSNGYQIRGIPIKFKDSRQVIYAVINYNPNGQISSLHFSIEKHLYNNVINESKNSTDLNRRKNILDFIENFKTAYCRKDLDFISKIFSNDALIITGYVYSVKVYEENTHYGLSKEKIEYNLYNKAEYLEKLAEIFGKNRFVNLFFDNIKIMQHPSITNMYGVTLKQSWRSTTYNDDGWLFMGIEFISNKEMLVHIRTWQPYILNNVVLPTEDIYQLGNFEFK